MVWCSWDLIEPGGGCEERGFVWNNNNPMREWGCRLLCFKEFSIRGHPLPTAIKLSSLGCIDYSRSRLGPQERRGFVQLPNLL